RGLAVSRQYRDRRHVLGDAVVGQLVERKIPVRPGAGESRRVCRRATSRRLIHVRLKWNQREQRTRSAPLPLVGRGWGWGSIGGSPDHPHPRAPHPSFPTLPPPPPPGQRSQACAGCASLPACADPPHKGEGRTECAALKFFNHKNTLSNPNRRLHPKRDHRSRTAFLSLAGSVAGGASSSASRK